MARRPEHSKKRQNKLSMILTTLVVCMLLIVVSIGSYSMRDKLANYRDRQASLAEQIALEHERTKEIENLEKYTYTMKYVEEIARKHLGFVYEGERIFRQEP